MNQNEQVTKMIFFEKLIFVAQAAKKLKNLFENKNFVDTT
jgi:hypothetical protein